MNKIGSVARATASSGRKVAAPVAKAHKATMQAAQAAVPDLLNSTHLLSFKSSKSNMPQGSNLETAASGLHKVKYALASCATFNHTDVLDNLKPLSSLSKLNLCQAEEITFEETKELFEALGPSADDALDFKRVAFLLQEALEIPFSDWEVEKVFEYTDQSDDGKVGVAELHKGLTGGAIRQLLKQLHRDKYLRQGSMDTVQVRRDLFLDRIVRKVNKNDALATLPITLVFTIVFTLLLIFHLRIWERQQVERGLERWLRDHGEVPGVEADFDIYGVKDPELFGIWLSSAAVPVIFGGLDIGPQAGSGASANSGQVRLASASFLVGDAVLKRKTSSGDVTTERWLLNSDEGRSFLQSRPADFAGAARAGLLPALEELGLGARRGLAAGASEIEGDIAMVPLAFSGGAEYYELAFCTYSEGAGMFAFFQLNFRFEDYGYVVPDLRVAAITFDPYHSSSLYVLDAIYIGLVLVIMYSECRDCWAAGRLGFKEFLDYWEFWNFVDWVNIASSSICTILWITCVTSMDADSLQQLLVDDGGTWRLKGGVMQLDAERLSEVHADMVDVKDGLFWLHFAVSITLVSIILRFFKAFQANPQLQLVSKTLIQAKVDIYHFLIVFSTIFVSFSMMGHVLFGCDLKEFYTIASSVMTAGKVLMGDFYWYVEVCQGAEDQLKSDMPRILLTLWFFSFVVFVLLILLNMLVAVILEKYQEESDSMKSSSDWQSIDQQVKSYVKEQWETMHFIPLVRLRRLLENDSNPAHKKETVTIDSLLEAFPSMTKEQGAWLMHWLDEEAAKQLQQEKDMCQDSQYLMNTLRSQHRVSKNITEDLRLVGLAVSNCGAQLDAFEKDFRVVLKNRDRRGASPDS